MKEKANKQTQILLPNTWRTCAKLGMNLNWKLDQNGNRVGTKKWSQELHDNHSHCQTHYQHLKYISLLVKISDNKALEQHPPLILRFFRHPETTDGFEVQNRVWTWRAHITNTARQHDITRSATVMETVTCTGSMPQKAKFQSLVSSVAHDLHGRPERSAVLTTFCLLSCISIFSHSALDHRRVASEGLKGWSSMKSWGDWGRTILRYWQGWCRHKIEAETNLRQQQDCAYLSSEVSEGWLALK